MAGTHMLLSRVVEEYLFLLDTLARSIDRHITLVSPLKGDCSFFEIALREALDLPSFDGRVVEARIYNSPTAVTIDLVETAKAISFLAIFLASRFSFQLRRLRETLPNQATNNAALPLAERGVVPFEIQIGSQADTPTEYGFRVRALFPGELYSELSLTINLSVGVKLQKLFSSMVERQKAAS
ncbi:MAG: hypothetical protein IPH75_16140 [bacterium]|nr:hypothetical protein [bacterium]